MRLCAGIEDIDGPQFMMTSDISNPSVSSAFTDTGTVWHVELVVCVC